MFVLKGRMGSFIFWKHRQGWQRFERLAVVYPTVGEVEAAAHAATQREIPHKVLQQVWVERIAPERVDPQMMVVRL